MAREKYHQSAKDKRDESRGMKHHHKHHEKVAHHLEKAHEHLHKMHESARTKHEHEAAAGRKYNRSKEHREHEARGMRRHHKD